MNYITTDKGNDPNVSYDISFLFEPTVYKW